MSDDGPPPCVLCGAPSIVGVGVVGEAESEAWYCWEHYNAAKVHAAQPVRRTGRGR